MFELGLHLTLRLLCHLLRFLHVGLDLLEQIPQLLLALLQPLQGLIFRLGQLRLQRQRLVL